MDKTAKYTCIASIMVSSLAFSDQEFPFGPAKNKSDGLVKYYCKLEAAQGKQTEACLDAVKAWGGEEIVAACADEVAKANASWPNSKYMDMVGGGYWHTGYHKDKDGSDHRHDWSDDARDMGGRIVGERYVQVAKNTASDRQTEKQSAAGKTWTTDGQVSASGKLFGTGVEGSVGHDQGGSSDSSTTVTSKGPTDALLDKAWRDGYSVGYKDPQKAGVNPDISCEKGHKTCLSSNGSPKNEYPKSDPPPVEEPKKTPSRTSEDNSSSSSDTKTASSSSDSPSPTPPPKINSHSSGELWAGDDYTKPDTMVATVAEDELHPSPLQNCVNKAVGKKYGKNRLGSMTITQSDSNKTPGQEREINKQMLKMGICDAGHWGIEFCDDFYSYGLGPSAQGTINIQDTTWWYMPDQPKPVLNPGVIDFANPDGLVGSSNPLDPSKPLPTFCRLPPC